MVNEENKTEATVEATENTVENTETETKKKKCMILCYHEESFELRDERLIDIGARDDLNEQAHRLFAALRDADTFDCDIIYAHLPKTEGIGLALYNRLIRAAAHTVMHV